MIAPLKPSVREARGAGDVLIADAVRINVRHSVHSLRTSGGVLPERVKTGKLRIVGGIYDLGTGAVTMTA
jgi:carbonic anhydrase